LQVSLPRQPCFKLNHRFQLKNFAQQTSARSMTGWYYRVLRPGPARAGMRLALRERPRPEWPVERVQEFLHRRVDDGSANAALASVGEMGAEARGAFAGRVARARTADEKRAKARRKKAREVRRREREARVAAAAAAGKVKEEEEDEEEEEEEDEDDEDEDDKDKDQWTPYRVVSKKRETDRIASFVLEPVSAEDGKPLPPAGGELLGAHARIRLPNGLVRAYSVVSGTPDRFELGIALADLTAEGHRGRGGSAWWHGLDLGDWDEETDKKNKRTDDHQARDAVVVQVARGALRRGTIPPAGMASNHAFVAGGVGVTAFLELLGAMRGVHWNATLHYAVRSDEDIPFRAKLAELCEPIAPPAPPGSRDNDNDGGQEGEGTKERAKEPSSVKVIYYRADRGERLDVTKLFAALPWNSHAYVCGPDRMMTEAAEAGRAAGLGEGDVHFEAFGADTGGDPFDVDVVLSQSNDGDDAGAAADGQSGKEAGEDKKQVRVEADETLLQVLQREFGTARVASSCEVGNCGTCKVTLRTGRVDHRGTALMEDEKENGMLSCVSRGIGRIAIEI
jgi:ferredoxin-NADP reductase